MRRFLVPFWMLSCWVCVLHVPFSEAAPTSPAKRVFKKKRIKRDWPSLIVVSEKAPWHIPLFTVLATQAKRTHLFVSGSSTPASDGTHAIFDRLKPTSVLALEGALPPDKLTEIVTVVPANPLNGRPSTLPRPIGRRRHTWFSSNSAIPRWPYWGRLMHDA